MKQSLPLALERRHRWQTSVEPSQPTSDEVALKCSGRRSSFWRFCGENSGFTGTYAWRNFWEKSTVVSFDTVGYKRRTLPSNRQLGWVGLSYRQWGSPRVRIVSLLDFQRKTIPLKEGSILIGSQYFRRKFGKEVFSKEGLPITTHWGQEFEGRTAGTFEIAGNTSETAYSSSKNQRKPIEGSVCCWHIYRAQDPLALTAACSTLAYREPITLTNVVKCLPSNFTCFWFWTAFEMTASKSPCLMILVRRWIYGLRKWSAFDYECFQKTFFEYATLKYATFVLHLS